MSRHEQHYTQIVPEWTRQEDVDNHSLYVQRADPKAAVAAPKAPLHLIPPVAAKAMAEALDDGRKKYGFFNWRHTNVAATVYIAAAKRHLDAWMDGEDLSADAGVHHFGHAMAGLAILLDAMAHGTLIDDRPPRLGLAKEEKYDNNSHFQIKKVVTIEESTNGN